MKFPIFNYISKFTGLVTKIYIPFPLNILVFWCVKRVLGISLKDSDLKLSEIKTVNQLFTRTLISKDRPISNTANFVVPCDSKFVAAVSITDKSSIKIKNISLDLNLFLQTNLTHYKAALLSFYLSPKDCHHVFMPTDAQIQAVTHIPGNLYPVSPLLARVFPRAFIENERVVITCKSADTTWYLVFVGALNVGKIHIKFCPECQTNCNQKKVTQYNAGFALKKGDPLGYFEMGSSVLIVHPELNESQFDEFVDTHVCYGEKLI
jgi:phosphatidylserine decarboxylase